MRTNHREVSIYRRAGGRLDDRLGTRYGRMHGIKSRYSIGTIYTVRWGLQIGLSIGVLIVMARECQRVLVRDVLRYGDRRVCSPCR